jgi:galactokinase
VDLRQQAVDEFTRRFGSVPAVITRAPGRVNLIGDHTDYNDGFVLPMTLDRAVWLAATPREDGRVLVHSTTFAETAEFALDGLHGTANSWLKYIAGVAVQLQQAGYATSGWQGVCLSDLPAGAGLSSSAALELAVARLFVALAAARWDAASVARLCQRAEIEQVGVNCGIMDQFASALGQSGHALFIDCRTLRTRALALPADCTVVVLDTGVQRELVNAPYNERRSECIAAANALGVTALRDADSALLDKYGATLPAPLLRRARHVVSENERVCRASDALSRGDVATLGKLMSASHRSLRDDFAVSCAELDAMVDIAEAQPGCHGARMTGAGFGGCAVALVSNEQVPGFITAVGEQYRDTTGLQAAIFSCAATDGAAVIE